MVQSIKYEPIEETIANPNEKRSKRTKKRSKRTKKTPRRN